MNHARIKQFAKRILPQPIVRQVGRLIGVASRRRSPRFSKSPVEIPGVLDCSIAYTQSGGFCVPSSSLHRPAAQQILGGSVYEPDTIEFMVAHGGDGDIVHAGTFFGDFLPALSRACVPAAKVWAFEPNPENFRCAQITCVVNGLENVALHKAALGSSRQTMQMVVRDRKGRSLGGGSRLVRRVDGGDQAAVETVDIVPLDEILPPDRRVSILQLDVEGFEEEALTGALRTIRQYRPIIIVENMPPEIWMQQNILSLQYNVFGQLHENTILRPELD